MSDHGDSSENVETRLVDSAQARLEVSIARGPGDAAGLIGAAHPAEALGAPTAELLRRAAGVAAACVNPRGIGRSSAGAPGLEDMADDVEAARRGAGLGRWVFWGMSGGGWLGLLHAHRHPGALAGLILESTCACFRERLADPSCVLSPFHPAWRAALGERGLVTPGSHDEVGDPDATEWEDVPGVGAVFRRTRGPALLVSPLALAPEMRRVMPALWAFDARGWLAELRVPTLVLIGTADPVVPVSHARSLADAIAGAELVLLEGAGHVPVGQRDPRLIDAVRRFVARIALLRTTDR